MPKITPQLVKKSGLDALIGFVDFIVSLPSLAKSRRVS